MAGTDLDHAALLDTGIQWIFHKSRIRHTAGQGSYCELTISASFAEFFKRAEPLCGRLLPEKLEFLFGAHASEVRSSVLVPVDGVGMLAIGSEDANRFHPGMGTVFVRLIAESIGAAIARFAT